MSKHLVNVNLCLIFFLLFLLKTNSAVAQTLPVVAENQTVLLRVMDEKGNTIPYAHVGLVDREGTYKGYGITNEIGQLQVNIGGAQKLVVSFTGFEPREILINGSWDGLVVLTEQVESLQEVVVTGQFKPVPVEQSLYKVKVIDSKVIQQRGAANLSDLLTMEMNTRIINDNILGSSILLQGMSGQNVKILLDGVPMIGGEAGEFDLSQLNMNNVERIEIIEGPLSVQYGTNALAGTINIITKDIKGSEKFHGGANLLYETIGQYNADVQVGSQMGKTKILTSFGRNQFTGFSSTNEPRAMNWNPKTQYNIMVRLTRKIRQLNLGVVYNDFLEESLSTSNPDPSTNFRTANDNLFNTRRNNGNVYLKGRIGRNGYVDLINNASFYGRTTNRYLVNVSDESRKKLSDVYTEFTTYTLRGSYSQTEISGGKFSFQTGYDLNFNYTQGERMDSTTTAIRDFGYFTSMIFQPTSKLEIQPAFRIVYNSKYDTRDVNFLNLPLPIIPSLNIKYAGEKGTIRLSYAKGFRAPSLRELYWDFEDANHSISGNVNLMPEIADNFIFSAQYRVMQRKGYGIELAPMAFFNDVNNKIELVEKDRSTLPAHRQNVNVARTYANIPSFRTKGFNFGLNYLQGENLIIRSGVGMIARSGSNSLGQDFYSWEASSNATYLLRAYNTSLNLFYKYNGPLSQFSLSGEGELKDRTLMDYHLLDISATRRFRNDGLVVTWGVKNIFNVTDIMQVGEGREGLVPRSGFKNMLPVERGTNAFVKISSNF